MIRSKQLKAKSHLFQPELIKNGSCPGRKLSNAYNYTFILKTIFEQNETKMTQIPCSKFNWLNIFKWDSLFYHTILGNMVCSASEPMVWQIWMTWLIWMRNLYCGRSIWVDRVPSESRRYLCSSQIDLRNIVRNSISKVNLQQLPRQLLLQFPQGWFLDDDFDSCLFDDFFNSWFLIDFSNSFLDDFLTYLDT